VPIKDFLVQAFALFVAASVFLVAFLAFNELLGLPRSGLVATIAFMGALKLVKETPAVRAADERARTRRFARRLNLLGDRRSERP
jgi:hypothetical protein